MKLEIDRKGLETLVKGSEPYYDKHNHPLIKKAGYNYNDQYGTSIWRNLSKLTEEELYKIYLICRR